MEDLEGRGHPRGEVAHDREAVGSDRDGGVVADVSRVEGRHLVPSGTGRVPAVHHLELAAADVAVADDREAVLPDGQRGARAHVPRLRDRGRLVSVRAGRVPAMDDLEVAVGLVPVADHRQPVHADRHRRVLAHDPARVEREDEGGLAGLRRVRARARLRAGAVLLEAAVVVLERVARVGRGHRVVAGVGARLRVVARVRVRLLVVAGVRLLLRVEDLRRERLQLLPEAGRARAHGPRRGHEGRAEDQSHAEERDAAPFLDISLDRTGARGRRRSRRPWRGSSTSAPRRAIPAAASRSRSASRSRRTGG